VSGTAATRATWWAGLEAQWKVAYNEAFFQKEPTEATPTGEELEELFTCVNFRFAGPRAFHANMSIELTNLSGLSALRQARILIVTNHQVAELTPLAELTGLTALFLNDNAIERLTGMENLVALTSLQLAGNQIRSLEPLEKLARLETLNCGSNKLASFAGLHTGNTEHLDHFVGLPNRVAQTEIDRLQNDLRVKVHGF